MTHDEFVAVLRQQQCKDEPAELSSDWGRARPITVNLQKLLTTSRSNHQHCGLVIDHRPNLHGNSGLYCSKHNKLVTWLNKYQVEYLTWLGYSETTPTVYTKIRDKITTDRVYSSEPSEHFAIVYGQYQFRTLYVTYQNEQYLFHWNIINKHSHKPCQHRLTKQTYEDYKLITFDLTHAIVNFNGVLIEYTWQKQRSQNPNIWFKGPGKII